MPVVTVVVDENQTLRSTWTLQQVDQLFCVQVSGHLPLRSLSNVDLAVHREGLAHSRE